MRPLLILRPESGASVTAERARALGLSPLCHPLFALRALEWQLPAGEFDGLLLTSANAVRFAGALPDLPVHAVGEATATEARLVGGRVESVGEGGVESLLATLPPDLCLLHLCGEERIVPSGERQQLVAVPVYRADPLPLPAPERIEGNVLLVHSPAAGRRLAEFAGRRGTVRIAAISAAAAAACGAGWERIEAADRPSDSALLPLAAELCKD